MMQSDEVIALIRGIIPDAQVQLEGADCNFTATVISPTFEGMRQVARQQQALSAFAEVLRRGELHAMSIKAYSPSEWQQQQKPVTIEG